MPTTDNYSRTAHAHIKFKTAEVAEVKSAFCIVCVHTRLELSLLRFFYLVATLRRLVSTTHISLYLKFRLLIDFQFKVTISPTFLPLKYLPSPPSNLGNNEF